MKQEFYLILPNIRSCHNVGAMFRTADAFGVTNIILAGYTAAPPKIQIDKVSLGAEKWIPFEQVELEKLSSKIDELKQEGFAIVSLEKNESSKDIKNVEVGEKVALIVGNEVDGVDDEVLELSDQVVHIPMHGKKESLNVSVAAGVAMYTIKTKQ